MRSKAVWSLFVALAVSAAVPAWAAGQRIVLDGTEASVNWSDGDSFRVTAGPKKGLKSRITGFNTLESYGAVHRWGEFTPLDLADNAKEATAFVRNGTWKCNTVDDEKTGKPITDHYGRTLISCPDLAKEVISRGLAHAFFVDERSVDAALLEVQAEAQREHKGMWAKGVPAVIVTSVHSADEKGSDKPYNRVVDTKTGLTRKVFHDKTYSKCTEVCVEDACLLYVPFDSRYGKQKEKCLYGDAYRNAEPVPRKEEPAAAPPKEETTPAPASGGADEEL